MRILFLANVVPYPPHSGVQLRLFHLIMRIAAKHRVEVGCHAWDDQDRDNARWLTRRGIPAVAAPLTAAGWRHALPAAAAALTGRPPEIVQFQSPVLHALVRDRTFDVVQVEETLLAPYADSVRDRAATRTVLTFHNIHAVQARRIAAIEKPAWRRLWRNANAAWMRRYEPAAAARFDRAVVVSETDRRVLLASTPHLNVSVIPNGVDTATLTPLPPPEPRPALVFVGTLSYRPCIDGVEWLVRDVLPLVRRQVPAMETWIVGKDATAEVEALAGDRVFVTGEVTDLLPYYRRAHIAVAPLRAGGGSRLKILEAMALGRPVVSTRIGAEGLDVQDGEHLLLADDAEGFAQAILRLLRDRGLWDHLTTRARRLVEAHYDWDAIAAAQMEIYDALARVA